MIGRSTSNPVTFHLIEQLRDLEDFCLLADSCSAIAVDTEFVRESTYFPKFCLMQIALPGAIFCIDPLKIESLEPLRLLLGKPHQTIIIHASRQDLEVFHRQPGALPSQLKDTQIAAGLAGLQDQIGYAPLTREILGVSVNKEQTRTDWSKRPLTQEQFDYAANDVRHLLEISERLESRLHDLGRRDWWIEDSTRLLDPTLYEPNSKLAWKRVSGIHILDPESGARAMRLAQWREEAAMHLDLPRNWVLRDESLIHFSRRPELPDDAIRIRGVTQEAQRTWTLKLNDKLREEPLDADVALFQMSAGQRPSPERKAALKALGQCVQAQSKALGIHPSLLASKRDLEEFMEKRPESRLTSGWRKAVIGDPLCLLLSDHRLD